MRIGTFTQRSYSSKFKHGNKVPVNFIPVLFTSLLIAVNLQLVLPMSQCLDGRLTSSYLHESGSNFTNTATTIINSTCIKSPGQIAIIRLHPFEETRHFVYQQQPIQHGKSRIANNLPLDILLTGRIHTTIQKGHIPYVSYQSYLLSNNGAHSYFGNKQSNSCGECGNSVNVNQNRLQCYDVMNGIMPNVRGLIPNPILI